MCVSPLNCMGGLFHEASRYRARASRTAHDLTFDILTILGGHRPPLQLKSSFKSGQLGLDAAVINITADFDAHAADQRRVIRERDA
jgi:hypothetical protein